jgi:hypothetical protein
MMDVLDIDLRGRTQGVQENSPDGAGKNEVDGFETLKALGIELPETLTASTPSGGRHYWLKHIEGGRSRVLGPGVEWFGKGKFVVAPPAPGREWLNDLPIAEASEDLKQLVLSSPSSHPLQGNSSGPLMSGGNGKVEIPSRIYFLLCRLMPKSNPRQRRRAIGLFKTVSLKQVGRNNALNYSAWMFRELIGDGAISDGGVCRLLTEACVLNGYLAKDGEEAMRLTIMSGLGIKEWPDV